VNEEATAVIRASFGKTRAGRLLLGAGVLALVIPAVAGCEAGNNAPTLEFHAASAGAQTVFNGISITNAFVLGGPSGATLPTGSSASLFVSLYNGGSSSDTLQSVSAPGWAGSISLSGGSVALPVNAAPVDLTGPQPKVVLENLTKPLTGGSYVPVTFDFAHAGSVQLQVPVEAQSYYWSTYSPPAPTASPSATPTGAAVNSSQTATPITSATPTGTPSGTTSATPTATP
jgi:copper(I)-binding protein